MIALLTAIQQWAGESVVIVSTEITSVIKVDSFSLHPLFPALDRLSRVPLVFNATALSLETVVKPTGLIDVKLVVLFQVQTMLQDRNQSYVNLTFSKVVAGLTETFYYAPSLKVFALDIGEPQVPAGQQSKVDLQEWGRVKSLFEWLIKSQLNQQLGQK